VTIRDLHQMVKEKHPSFVFLIETICSKKTFGMDKGEVRLCWFICGGFGGKEWGFGSFLEGGTYFGNLQLFSEAH
jgi:hypothetical protein